MNEKQLKLHAHEWAIDKLRNYFCNEDQQGLSENEIIEEFTDEYSLAMDAFIAGKNLQP